VYGIEATCHASHRLTDVYKDVFRILQPGGLFAFYEWIITDKYDPENEQHKQIKQEILVS
jgi:sterol 24-C-methyltransferase